jgi:hypothetical protein
MENPCIKGMTVDTCPFNPRLGCDCGANKPRVTSSEHDIPLRNPVHGGKITCHKCGGFLFDKDFVEEHYGVHFHDYCFNRYEHYYGLDKPLD